MSVLEDIRAQEEAAAQLKAKVLEENRTKLSEEQEKAREQAANIVAEAREQARQILARAREELARLTESMTKEAAAADDESAQNARGKLPQAAARIVERIEHK